MEFRSGKIGSFLSQTRPAIVRLAAGEVQFSTGGEAPRSLAYRNIVDVRLNSWMAGWADVTVSAGGQRLEAKRLAASEARKLQQELVARIRLDLAKAIGAERASIEHFSSAIEALYSKPTYLADRDRRQWIQTYLDEAPAAHRPMLNFLAHPLLDLALVEPEIREKVSATRDLAFGRSEIIQERNRDFVEQELARHARFFDQVEKLPLTDEQRRAAVIMEDRNLLVAPAGSGKTSALIGKIGYALTSGLCAPADILVVAFNNSARDELRERIAARLSGFAGIDAIQVHTFHSLGQQIIAGATGKKPSLAKTAEDDFARGRLFQKIFERQLATSVTFRMNYILFRALYATAAPDPASFKTSKDWQEHVRSVGQTVNGRTGFRTFKQELVKSQGEVAIANWLFLNGIEYEYERPYQYETADQQYRQYKPDFYFPAAGLYLEHYALDETGKPPAAFGEKYAASMEWKRALHTEKKTECLETTFAEFVNGTLFEKLERELRQRGIEPAPRPEDEVFAIVQKEAASATPLAGLMSTAARHAKSNLMDEEAIKEAASGHRFPARARMFASLLLPVIAEYEGELRSAGEIDFEDMIGLAISNLKAGELETAFKLVLVDEFQDISMARARLIRAILEQTPEAKLFAVGDDWQAIYRFAGSDIGLFWDFEKFFGRSERMFLTRTFRFNQGIADISASVVSQNPQQLPKQVVSTDERRSKVVASFFAETEEGEKSAFLSILNRLAQTRQEGAPPVRVFVLARYNKILERAEGWLREFRSQDVETSLLTIHRSKGLEADYVILLGMNSRPYGFPSTMDDDPLLEMVMPRPETYPFAEEQRLLYVALTRTRNVAYTISNARMRSKFMKDLAATWVETGELQRIHIGPDCRAMQDPDWCPDCLTGVLLERQSRFGSFGGCSRFPECHFKRA